MRFGIRYEEDDITYSSTVSAWLEEKETRRQANAIRNAYVRVFRRFFGEVVSAEAPPLARSASCLHYHAK